MNSEVLFANDKSEVSSTAVGNKVIDFVLIKSAN